MPPLNWPIRLTTLPKMVLLVLSALALSGCFYNDDDPAPLPPPAPPPIVDADPIGYYTNSGSARVMMADNTTPRSDIEDLQGMVHGGQLMMLSDLHNVAYIGTLTVNGNDFSGRVTVYEAGEKTQENVAITGTVMTATKALSGTLGGSGVANGTFQLNYAADNGPLALSTVVRLFDWRAVVNPNIPGLNLGNVTDNINTIGTGSNIFSGCDYSGRIEPVAGRHLYTVSVTVENCSNADVEATSTYTGLASMRGPNRFILALSNGSYDFSGEYMDVSPAGYYDNTGTASVSDGAGGTTSITDLQAMVSGNRIMMLSADNKLLYDGTITSISGNSYTADFVIYNDGENPVMATASGIITIGSSISGTLSGAGIGSDGTFNLLYAQTNNQAAEMVLTWRSDRVGGGFDEFGFIINAVGNLTHDETASFGWLFDACQMNGTVTAISGTRLYRVDVELTNCDVLAVNGDDYTGLATTKDGTATNNRLVLLVTNGLYTLSGEFEPD